MAELPTSVEVERAINNGISLLGGDTELPKAEEFVATLRTAQHNATRSAERTRLVAMTPETVVEAAVAQWVEMGDTDLCEEAEESGHGSAFSCPACARLTIRNLLPLLLAPAQARVEAAEASLALYSEAMERGRKLWQDAHPDSTSWPDAAKQWAWLADRLAVAEKRICEICGEDSVEDALRLIDSDWKMWMEACEAIKAAEEWPPNNYPSMRDRWVYAALLQRAQNAEREIETLTAERDEARAEMRETARLLGAEPTVKLSTLVLTAQRVTRAESRVAQLTKVLEDAPVASRYHSVGGFHTDRFIADYEAWMAQRRSALQGGSDQ